MNYSYFTKYVFCCGLLVGIQTVSFAQQSNRSVVKGLQKPVISYRYSPNMVYEVRAGLGVTTQIILDPNDKIRDYGSGFATGWEIIRKDNILTLKPKDADAETNLYIRTDLRSYLFDLKIVSKDWKKIDEVKNHGVTYLIEFSYPEVAAANLAALEAARNVKVKEPIDPPKPVSNPYFSFYTDYETSADNGLKWMVPSRVYDDGSVTYVFMPESNKSPVFFGRNGENGEEYIVNSSMRNGAHVLQGIFPFIIVRHGENVIAIRRR